jgi:hypothetical protein
VTSADARHAMACDENRGSAGQSIAASGEMPASELSE